MLSLHLDSGPVHLWRVPGRGLSGILVSLEEVTGFNKAPQWAKFIQREAEEVQDSPGLVERLQI